MKKFLKLVMGVFVLFGLIYCGGFFYFQDHFNFNSQYAGIDISNLTVKAASDKVEKQLLAKEYKLIEDGQTVKKIQLADLKPTFNLNKSIKQAFKQQDHANWMSEMLTAKVYADSLDQEVDLDVADLASDLNQSELKGNKRKPAIQAELAYDEAKGYYATEGQAGTEIQAEKLEEVLDQALTTKETDIKLEEAYDQPIAVEDNKKLQDKLTKIDKIANNEFSFELGGDTVETDKKKIESWMTLSDDDEIQLDREAIAAYLTELNEKYSTFNKYREFNSTNFGKVEVQPGILGWEIDVEAETEAIASALEAGKSVPAEPVFYSTGGIAGAADDIGDTYVEVDLASQTMYLYYEGTLITETPIVSGKDGAETVPGANAVIEMLTDTNLVGYNQFYNVNYSTPVSYWIRFDDKAQGIHDAPWQSAFGGDVHTYAGSLGCINTPYDQVSLIYSYVDYGTPVIVF